MRTLRTMSHVVVGLIVALIAGCSGGSSDGPDEATTAAAGVSQDHTYRLSERAVHATPSAPAGVSVDFDGRGAVRIEVDGVAGLGTDVAFTTADGPGTDVDLYVPSSSTPPGSHDPSAFPHRSIHLGSGEERVVLPASEAAAFQGRPVEVVVVAREPGSFTFRADVAGGPQEFAGGTFDGATGRIADETHQPGETRWYELDLEVPGSNGYWREPRVVLEDVAGEHELIVCRPGTASPSATAAEATSNGPTPREVVDLGDLPGWSDVLPFETADSVGRMLVGVRAVTPGDYAVELAGRTEPSAGPRIPRSFTMPTVIRGLQIQEPIPVDGGQSPYSFRVADGRLPDGLTIANDAIEGTASAQSQDQQVVIAVEDNRGEVFSRPLSITCDTVQAEADLIVGVEHAEVDLTLNGTHHFAGSDRTFAIGPELDIGRNVITYEARSLDDENRGTFTLEIRDTSNGQLLFQTDGQASSYRHWLFWTRYRVETIGQGTVELDWNGQQLVRQ